MPKKCLCFPEVKTFTKFVYYCVAGEKETFCKYYKSSKDCDLCCWKKRDGSNECTLIEAQEEARKNVEEL